MCEQNCNCVICEMESLEKSGYVSYEEERNERIIEYKLKAMELFEEFVKSGLGS